MRARTGMVLILIVVPSVVWLAMAGARYFFQPKIDSQKSQLSGIARLGELLFDDTNLSEPVGLACVSCHDPNLKRQGINESTIPAVAVGSRPAVFGNRNVPTIMYSYDIQPFRLAIELGHDGAIKYVPMGGLFWDGRADSLSEQARAPMLNPLEMNNPNIETVVAKVKAGDHAALFVEVFGPQVFDDPTVAMGKITEAIAFYQKTTEFSPFSSKFDSYLRGQLQLSPLEAKGFELFKNPDKGNCIACHAGKQDSKRPEDWLFTDFTYDVLGAPRNRAIPENADAQHFDLGLCQQPGIAKKLPIGFDVKTLCGAFKVPTLRNVADTGPYFHNGVIANLRDAVELYVTRDVKPERWYSKKTTGEANIYDDLPVQYHHNVNTAEAPYDIKKGGVARLSAEDIDAVIAFLNTLTDVPEVD